MVEYFFPEDAIKEKVKNSDTEGAKLLAMYFKQSLPTYGRPQHPVLTGHSLWFCKICFAFLTSCNMLPAPADGEETSSATGPWSHFHIPVPLRDCDSSHIQCVSGKLLGHSSSSMCQGQHPNIAKKSIHYQHGKLATFESAASLSAWSPVDKWLKTETESAAFFLYVTTQHIHKYKYF